MAKIPFTVSARTARLIGQENFTNAEGAIIELVKNTYDADANACIVYFDNRYSDVPTKISQSEYDKFTASEETKKLISSSFKPDKQGAYLRNGKLSKNKIDELAELFQGQNAIYIIDNGNGMDDKIIKDHWMTIGTNQKLTEVFSKSGRVQAGAKGIGRFSLDRLGDIGRMITFPRDRKSKSGFEWKVNWNDFEKLGAKIGEINAELNEIHQSSYRDIIKEFIPDPNFTAIIDKSDFDFSQGTLLKISNLRDDWSEKAIAKIFSSLEILTPPEGQEKFNIYVHSFLEEEEKYGLIDNGDFSDFDYKLDCSYLDDDKKTLSIKIFREEFDKDLFDDEVFKYEEMSQKPYRKTDFYQDFVEIKTSLFDLIPGIKDKDKKALLDGIGEFKFTLYFLKRVFQNDLQQKYFYKNFNSTQRSKWLEKFGGIRIFKDSFRVRPYGELNTSYFDWLSLGDRYAQDPSSVTRVGRYKVRPNQVAGSISISRLSNLRFQEKSSREGFQENSEFELFKNIIIAIIGKFETDRSTIISNLDKLYKEKNKDEAAEQEAAEVLEKEEKEGGKDTSKKSREELEKEYEQFKKGFQSQQRKLEEKDEEIKLLRALASAGLTIASFAHEFNKLSRILSKRAFELRANLENLIPEKDLNKLALHKNPYHQIDQIKKEDEKLKLWVDFTLQIVRKDKRRASAISLGDYFQNLWDRWDDRIKDRQAVFELRFDIEKFKDIRMKIYELDLDSIFDNLIANSLEAFKKSGYNEKRVISVKLTLTSDDNIEIVYKDSGPGLVDAYKNTPNEIFKPFETSKVDDQGNKVGTGLGMWIVKSICDENKCNVKIHKSKKGFGIEFLFKNKRIYKDE